MYAYLFVKKVPTNKIYNFCRGEQGKAYKKPCQLVVLPSIREEVIAEVREEIRDEIRKEIRDSEMKVSIQLYKELGMSIGDASTYLRKRYELDENEIRMYIEKYWL